MSYDQPAPEAEEPTQTQAAQSEATTQDQQASTSSNPADEQQHHDAETNEDTASGGAPA